MTKWVSWAYKLRFFNQLVLLQLTILRWKEITASINYLSIDLQRVMLSSDSEKKTWKIIFDDICTCMQKTIMECNACIYKYHQKLCFRSFFQSQNFTLPSQIRGIFKFYLIAFVVIQFLVWISNWFDNLLALLPCRVCFVCFATSLL